MPRPADQLPRGCLVLLLKATPATPPEKGPGPGGTAATAVPLVNVTGQRFVPRGQAGLQEATLLSGGRKLSPVLVAQLDAVLEVLHVGSAGAREQLSSGSSHAAATCAPSSCPPRPGSGPGQHLRPEREPSRTQGSRLLPPVRPSAAHCPVSKPTPSGNFDTSRSFHQIRLPVSEVR